DHKSVTIIIEPAGEKGIGFLQYDYEQKGKETDQWLYLSALGKVKRIVSGNENEPKTGSFFGSELSYEDMEKRHLDDYTYKLLGEETYAKRPCVVIETIPTKEQARKSNYSKSRDWIDRERNIILKSVLYNRQGKKVKRIYFGRIKTVDGIVVPMQIVVLNLDTERRTVMTYENIALNVDVKDAFLTRRALTDGAFRESHLKKYQENFR
ncbi:MAG: outer membrane lipoprotein-sorting protein, partial [Desulfobacterales bacterium]